MSTGSFDIGADAVDVGRINAEIRDTVAAKMKAGAYAGAQLARAERFNLMNLKRDENFFEFYMDSLREAVYVDINDFEIRERRATFAPLLIRIKRTLWSLLKFYTYRLWSQQNTVNGLLVTGIESLEEKYAAKVRSLEARVAELEKRLHRAP